MAIYFTSDTHFGHPAIMRLSRRPFQSVAEMDAALIAEWNAVVAPGDTVYHLGDFCFRNARPAPDYLAELNGEVHLIVGNHDGATLKRHSGIFASVKHIREIGVNGRTIVLCHYPMREWHGCWRGAWHFFGHVHGRLNHEPVGCSLDVGVDSNRFRPWQFEEIEALFAERQDPFTGERPRPVKKTIREP
jgi:calcineurin-like phosphoesterase family protein